MQRPKAGKELAGAVEDAPSASPVAVCGFWKGEPRAPPQAEARPAPPCLSAAACTCHC